MNKLLYLLFLVPLYTFSQQDTTLYCIAFYNVENVFDPSDDTLKNDDAFTPTGMNHWSYAKFSRKINNIAKVMIALGKGYPPDVIGIAEIENKKVLNAFCYHSPLKKYNYSYVHYDSPDPRGIDVALLYRADRIKVTQSKPIRIRFPFDTNSRSRDILQATLLLNQNDSIVIFINHWTSRYGGYAATIPKRNYFATVLKALTDSLLAINPQCNILIMGDFNDYPTDQSLHDILKASRLNDQNAKLVNLMFKYLAKNNVGTHKQADFWGCLDQIIVSQSLLQATNTIKIIDNESHIFMEDFMIEPDEKYGGVKVYRTYLGPRYFGGFSDHLPIYIYLKHYGDK